MVGNSRVAPTALWASDEEQLEKKIRLLQQTTHKQYTYISIYPSKTGVVAWFYSDGSAKKIVEALNAKNSV